MINNNKRFAELAGICTHENIWHDPKELPEMTFYDKCLDCGKLLRNIDDPDFTDAREVLKVMMEREDYYVFLKYINAVVDKHGIWCIEIPLILDTTGKLRDLAIEWMEKERKENE